eukprot:CAMPEP_0194172700 /NCGR_PEP_ID=MMETSP0154-20130528/7147_1 /TAXON_ID=1049557 /ORGANISM="Thalassiothrix antarctica, Strain L6-D1" /LENGTH=135 /DNA_ID=CAMNT_0038885487 /DNA_START=147 /DNA_END=554 /DNA_ORIENTATION=-
MKFLIILSLITSIDAFSFSIENVAKKFTEGVVVASIGFAIATQPAMAGDIDAGETVFNANCAACHVGGQNLIRPEKTLEKEALDQFLAGGRTEASVAANVRNGKNSMPAFGGRLSDNDIENIATYVIESSESGWD